jgi:glycosyltransferase involved in cell wall biosynthesis
MKLAVIIPALDEMRTIRGIVQRTLAVCADVAVIDDGSRDGTGEALAGLPVTVLRHDANRGKAAALRTGFAWALASGATAIVTQDGDGQHRPEDITRLVQAARRHPDRLVIAARLHGRENYPPARNLANRWADFWISWAAGHRVVDSQSGQRLYPAALLRNVPLERLAAGFAFESEIVIRAARSGFLTVAVPITAIHEASGRRSHFRPVRDFARIARMIAGYLLRSGMNPRGLWCSLCDAPLVLNVREATAPPAIASKRTSKLTLE